ncbi:MAG: UvrD-helicase domain-containing protein [Opitutales bacterium]|nr:UvrD-helicase domain-containing protein [Opitutales bacterium]
MSGEFDFAESPLAEGLSVIEASAGTGKTYAISHLVPRLLLDGTVDSVADILLVTFTKAAAAELADRVRRVLEGLAAPPGACADEGAERLRARFGEERTREVIDRALLDLDRLNVSTIHSFCMQVLQSEGTLCGLPVLPELVPDASDIVEQSLRDLWENEVAGDAVTAAVAAAASWDIGNDLGFVAQALSIPGVTFHPEARSWDGVADSLRGGARRFTAECCAEVADLLGGVDRWKKDSPDEWEREAILKTVGEADETDAPGFLGAVGALAEAPEWVDGRSKANKAAKAALASCSAVTAAADFVQEVNASGWHFRIHCLERVRARVNEALRARRRITYDGVITTLCDALTRGRHAAALAGALRERFKVALIDESQDTDPRQFLIFEKIFLDAGDPRRLVLIGDPKQAIYAFRGADVNTYLDARDRAAGNGFTLTKTYRAPQNLVRAVNAFYIRETSFLKDGLQFHPAESGLEGDTVLEVNGAPVESRIEAWIVPDGDEAYATQGKRTGRIADTVATEIVRLLNAGARIVETKAGGGSVPVGPGHCAVLVGKHREAEAVEAALRARGVPAVRAGGDDIMTSGEAGDLLVLLRALYDPRRTGLLLAALSTRLLGYDADAVRRVRESGGEKELEDFLRWQTVWRRDGVAAAVSAVDSEAGLTVRLASTIHGERSITNLRQLTDLLQAASAETGNDPARLIRWLTSEIARAGGRSDVEERQQQLESDADAVQLVTMHSAKGLEYPLVFCPFLWSAQPVGGVRRLARRGEPVCLVDTGQAEDPGLLEELHRADIEDRLRLAYVAMTRARVRLWIFAGELSAPKSKSGPSALDWLLREDPEEDFTTWRGSAADPGREGRHRAGLESLGRAGEAASVIAWREPPEPDDTAWSGDSRDDGGELSPLATPVIPVPWEMTSFSALTREKSPYAGTDEAVEAEAPAEPANLFTTGPGGTAVGTAVHDWIEGWDFGDPDAQRLEHHLARYPLPGVAEPPSLAERVHAMLGELRGAVLPGMERTIAETCPAPGASEWLFRLPVEDALDPAALAAVFARHGEEAYASVLANLPGDRLRGYLHGFIDRIAVHGGQWGVIDWKTNYLGPSASDYDLPHLVSCARHSHYILQAHLYLVALRRFLGRAADVRGAWIVFLRGVQEGTARGVLHVDPSAALMDDLDTLFAKGTH